MSSKVHNPCPFHRDDPSAKPPASPAPPPPKPLSFVTTSIAMPIRFSKTLLDDCVIDAEDLIRMMTEPRPPREPIVQPKPSIEFTEAESALRSILEAGCETDEGYMQDKLCFYCRRMLDYEPHSDKCDYIAAKAFIDKIDNPCSTTPDTKS